MKKVYIKTVIKKIGVLFACLLVLSMPFVMPVSASTGGINFDNPGIYTPFVSYGDFYLLYETDAIPNYNTIALHLDNPTYDNSPVAFDVLLQGWFNIRNDVQYNSFVAPSYNEPGRKGYRINRSSTQYGDTSEQLGSFVIVSDSYMRTPFNDYPVLRLAEGWEGTVNISFDYFTTTRDDTPLTAEHHEYSISVEGGYFFPLLGDLPDFTNFTLISNYRLTATPTTPSSVAPFEIYYAFDVDYPNIVSEAYVEFGVDIGIDSYNAGFHNGVDFSERSWVDWIVVAVGGFFSFELFPGFSLGGLLGVLVVMAVVIMFLKYHAGG